MDDSALLFSPFVLLSGFCVSVSLSIALSHSTIFSCESNTETSEEGRMGEGTGDGE